MLRTELVIGAVAYDPRVVTIWEGFRAYLAERGIANDYVLYSNYDRQVEDLLDGRIDVAWNSPLAWVRCLRMARAADAEVTPVVMRDTDQDVRSVIVVRSGSGFSSPVDLRGAVVAVGAHDSPQATLIPLAFVASQGLVPGRDFEVLHHEVLAGLHGDHVGGERDAAIALIEERADAACMIRENYLAFVANGVIPALTTEILATTPAYDHCVMVAGPGARPAGVAALRDALLAMDPADPEAARLFELEGLGRWLPARTTGYGALESAVDRFGFYDAAGSPRPSRMRLD